ncbi:hypothetical protein NST33_17820 [Paenibacillus sp. FSL L8-0435]|uniref:hypothetical protein n=1 Tax=Paenibacillus sp. FSL L8-0435 TaxID=2954618 RepID=UPI0030DBE5F6
MIITSFLVIYVLIAIPFIPWLTHISMTKSSTESCGWANYKQFKENWNKYEWTPLRHYPKFFENEEHKCYFHVGVIKFENKGMKIRDPISYWLAKRYVRKLHKLPSVKW